MITTGRGSNPKSRRNLTGSPRDAYVFERGAGVEWTVIAGPMTYHAAYKRAQRLEALNHAGGTMYAASRRPPG